MHAHTCDHIQNNITNKFSSGLCLYISYTNLFLYKCIIPSVFSTAGFPEKK